jgi:hypothetical protein
MIKLLGYGDIYIGVIEARVTDDPSDKKKVGIVMTDVQDMDTPVDVGTPYDAKDHDLVMIFDHEDAIDILEAALKEVRMMLKQYKYQNELRKEGFGGDEQTKH